MEYREYTNFEFGNPTDLADVRVDQETSVWDKQVANERTGFPYHTWGALILLAVVVCGILFFGWADNVNDLPIRNNESGLVNILEQD